MFLFIMHHLVFCDFPRRPEQHGLFQGEFQGGQFVVAHPVQRLLCEDGGCFGMGQIFVAYFTGEAMYDVGIFPHRKLTCTLQLL